MLAGVSKWAEINAPWGEDVVGVLLVCRGWAVFPCSCPGPSAGTTELLLDGKWCTPWHSSTGK